MNKTKKKIITKLIIMTFALIIGIFSSTKVYAKDTFVLDHNNNAFSPFIYNSDATTTAEKYIFCRDHGRPTWDYCPIQYEEYADYDLTPLTAFVLNKYRNDPTITIKNIIWTLNERRRARIYNDAFRGREGFKEFDDTKEEGLKVNEFPYYNALSIGEKVDDNKEELLKNEAENFKPNNNKLDLNLSIKNNDNGSIYKINKEMEVETNNNVSRNFAVIRYNYVDFNKSALASGEKVTLKVYRANEDGKKIGKALTQFKYKESGTVENIGDERTISKPGNVKIYIRMGLEGDVTKEELETRTLYRSIRYN